MHHSALFICRSGFWNTVGLYTVNPIFVSGARGPLNVIFLDRFPAQNTRQRITHLAIPPVSPYNQFAVFSVKPGWKSIEFHAAPTAHAEQLSDHPPLCTSDTVIVNRWRLLRLLADAVPVYSCSYYTIQLGMSFFIVITLQAFKCII